MELTIKISDTHSRVGITGPGECNLKIIREALGVSLSARDDALRITGKTEPVGRAAHVIERLTQAACHNRPMSREQLLDLLATTSSASPESLRTFQSNGDHQDAQRGLEVYLPGRRITPATAGQRHYLDGILNHDLTFCCGPAGTGKTYLAVAAAVAMLKRGECRKLVLVRPAVEAGEKLGFLPGTMQEKVNPYLRPLLDALYDMMAFEQVERFMAVDLIEIVPLAFMRGRTLNDACIICDEAQNTTRGQMLMLLTRLGHGSKMVVTGDTSQIDLEDPRDSGLVDAVRRLRRIKGVATCTLDGTDIVRHTLVQRVVEAYGGTAHKPQNPLISDVNDD